MRICIEKWSGGCGGWSRRERERGEGRKEREDMEFAETNFSNSKKGNTNLIGYRYRIG